MVDSGFVAGNRQNNTPDRASSQRSKFPLSYNLYHTARFGEISSHFSFEAVRGDTIPLRSEHDLRTYSFKAPLMQDIEFHKAYFSVPYECILPINWQKIITQPNLGDDINAQLYGCSVEQFYFRINDLLRTIYSSASTTTDSMTRIQYVFYFFVIGSLIYSRGSLMWQLGYHNDLLLSKVGSQINFDQWVELFGSILSDEVSDGDPLYVKISDVDFAVLKLGSPLLSQVGKNRLSIREFFDTILHEGDFRVSTTSTTTVVDSIADAFSSILDYTIVDSVNDSLKPINLSRVLAYQLSCAHYFSNDSVDYIFSAELYRENIFSLVDTLGSSIEPTWYHSLQFNYNGVSTNVDYLSASVFLTLITFFKQILVRLVPFSAANLPLLFAGCQYFINVFGFQNSLRYRDYFTGSRTRPLAVGDVNVGIDAINNTVNVIDITRNIQMQRFLNSVNRTGRKFEKYLEGLISGRDVGYDYHNPQFLAHVKDIAYAVEVENTGASQMEDPNSVTAVVKSNSARFAFEFTPDRPCVLIGVEYFDIARNYSHQMDRQLFHVDRFDMFIPDLQYIGDQEIYGAEVSMNNLAPVFGYRERYAEFHQKVNQMVGGFVDSLPGYAFSASETKFANHYPLGQIRLSPYFIRSHPFELDSFYLLLTGFSLEKYFHFIIKSKNHMADALRPMAKHPNIL